MDSERLKKQLDFLIEADKMKSLYRQTYIIGNESRGASMREFEGEEQKYKRRENDAEHSFHLALFVIMLAEYANEPIDVLKAVKTVLIHDIVEIDAGDTYFFDDKGYETKRDRETRAADRLFGLLPMSSVTNTAPCGKNLKRAAHRKHALPPPLTVCSPCC